MKVKKIMMSILFIMGFIAAKAEPSFPPELVLVSQPVMTYNDYSNTITVYYDVQNIGDYRYKGYVYIYLDPDDGYYYAREWVRVSPGNIKRIAIDIPAYRPNPNYTYTIMPYYELDDELYSFTTFEYFDPLTFHWNGPRNEYHVVINLNPVPRYYNRPCDYRCYYDGYRPPMPPPSSPGFAAPAPSPLDPAHHTYSYHYNNGGYPATHNFNEGAHVNGNEPSPSDNGQASVKHHNNGTSGSMSSNEAGVSGQNNFSGSNNNGTSGSMSSNEAGVSGQNNFSGSNNNDSSARPSGNQNGKERTSSHSSNNTSTRSRSNDGNSNVGRSGNSGSSNGTTARPSSGSTNSNRSGNSSSTSSSRTSRTSSSSSRSSATTSSNSRSSSSNSRTSSNSTSSTRSSNSSSGARR